MSRLFKGYASNYRADQTQACKVRRKQKRTLRVDFNAAIPTDRTLASVTWECDAPWITFLSNAAIDGREVAVDVEFNFAGFANIKATATDSAGEELNYEFQFTVTDAPIYPSATYSTTSGPYSITATA